MAPPPPPRPLTKQELQKLEEQEEDTLRELRLFLRDVTNRLAQDKRFKAFTKPVDTEEVRQSFQSHRQIFPAVDLMLKLKCVFIVTGSRLHYSYQTAHGLVHSSQQN